MQNIPSLCRSVRIDLGHFTLVTHCVLWDHVDVIYKVVWSMVKFHFNPSLYLKFTATFASPDNASMPRYSLLYLKPIGYDE